MRRRALLRGAGAAAAGAVALPGVGTLGGARSTDAYEPLGSVDLDGAAEAVVGPDGEWTYVATGDGFATVDVSDPANPTVAASVTGIGETEEKPALGSILDVKVDGDRLLVSGPAQVGRRQGLVVYDVSDPTDPVPATEFYGTGYSIHNSFLLDGHAYLTRNPTGQATMAIVDVSTETPESVGVFNPLTADVGVDGWDDLSFFPGTLHDLYVHDGVAYCAFWDAGTWMVDVSDPADPSYLGRVGDYTLEELVELADDRETLSQYYWEDPGNDHYVAVDDEGSLLAVGGEAWDDPDTEGGGPAGVDLWDVSDRSNPRKLSTIDPVQAPDTTRGGTWTTSHNFDLHGDRLYTSWYEAGVKVHDVSDPADPELLAWWRRPDEAMFWTAQVAVPGEFYVASSYPARDHRAALYTFPDEAGQQPNAPRIAPAEPTRTETATGTATRTETPTRTRTRTETETETATATPTATPTDGTDESAGGGAPGFGVLATLVGLGAGAYGYLRRRDRS